MKKEKITKTVKSKEPKDSIESSTLNGLEQSFKGLDGNQIYLKDILTDKDWWVLKKRKSETTIILHSAVQKIAEYAGITTNPRYSILISPTHENNHTVAMQIEICDTAGRCSSNIGEVNRDNLGTRGRQNPVNMAQKRAYDRAVFSHLGITGLLGEDEIVDDVEEKEMDKLPIEEQKIIVPFINAILSAKSNADLKAITTQIKTSTTILNEAQLNVLRGLWKKQAAELIKTF